MQQEKDFLEVYLYMSELKGQGNGKFLFCPTSLKAPSLYQLESRTNNYQKTIQNQYNIDNFDSNKVRKILNSYWAENVSEHRQIRSIDQATGHSRGAASMHYEVARNKATNSAHTTLLTNKKVFIRTTTSQSTNRTTTTHSRKSCNLCFIGHRRIRKRRRDGT